MYTNDTLSKKITNLYPDIAICGIDITVVYDTKNKAWVVDLKKGGHELLHQLKMTDVEACMDGKQCGTLGQEISQLKKNIEWKRC